jgi:hypothetical protein
LAFEKNSRLVRGKVDLYVEELFDHVEARCLSFEREATNVVQFIFSNGGGFISADP